MNNFLVIGRKIEVTHESKTDVLNALEKEVEAAILTIPEKIILRGFIAATKEYSDIKSMCSGNDPEFNIAADRLNIFKTYFNYDSYKTESV